MRYFETMRSAKGRSILFIVVLASGIAFLSDSSITIAIPTIQKVFNTNLTAIQWIVSARLIFLASLLLVGGAIGDLFGRKRVFVVGIGIFAVSAIISGLSANAWQLIIFQSLQGVGAAFMVPQSLSIINSSFPEDQRGQAIGLWAGLSGLISTPGPWLAGWLINTFSWRAIFFTIGGFGAIALASAFLILQADRTPKEGPLDWKGAVLILLGMLGITFFLIMGQEYGWSNILVLIALAFGAVNIVAFILVEIHHPRSLVPLRIFKNPMVAAANAETFLIYFSLNGAIFFLALNLQQIQGFSATTAGLALLAPTVLITMLSGPAGILADKIGPRLQMIVAPVMLAVGCLLLAFFGSGSDYFVDFLPGLILIGLAMSLFIAPLTKSALSVDRDSYGSASGVNNAVARFAALTAIAVLSAIVLQIFTSTLKNAIAVPGLTIDEQTQILAQSSKLGGINIPGSFAGSAHNLAQQAIKASFSAGFRWAMIICAALCAAGSLVSIFLIRNSQTNSKQQE